MPATSRAGAAGDVHAVVEQRLRQIDQRYTGGRRAIVELIIGTGHPVSIGDISEALPRLPRSSAYRHLADLQTAGVVRRIAADDEFARFELAEDLTEHHHHLLCVNCGKVTDFTLPPALEREIGSAIGRRAGAEGFAPRGHRLDVFGVCGTCA